MHARLMAKGENHFILAQGSGEALEQINAKGHDSSISTPVCGIFLRGLPYRRPSEIIFACEAHRS